MGLHVKFCNLTRFRTQYVKEKSWICILSPPQRMLFLTCDMGPKSRTASSVAYRLRTQIAILQRLEETQQRDTTPVSTRPGSVDD